MLCWAECGLSTLLPDVHLQGWRFYLICYKYHHYVLAKHHWYVRPSLPIYKHHLENNNLYAEWNPINCSQAQQLLARISSFNFIIGFLILHKYLLYLAGITTKLHQKALHIIKAHEMIAKVTTTYMEEHENIDDGFTRIYTHSVRMADIVGNTDSMPQISHRQHHFGNLESTSSCDYFRRIIGIYIVFLAGSYFVLLGSPVLCISHHCLHPYWHYSIHSLHMRCKIWQCCFEVWARPTITRAFSSGIEKVEEQLRICKSEALITSTLHQGLKKWPVS